MTTRQATTETSATGSSIRVGFRTGSVAVSRLRFIRQVGATDVFIDHSSTDEEPQEFLDKAAEKDRLVIDGDVIPTTKQPDEAEACIEVVKQPLRNLWAADIPILGYQWNPRGLVPVRTRTDQPVRGAAKATEFDLKALDTPFERADTVERGYTEAEFWANYERFVEEVVPVAEEAGVRMALHPVDPPGIEQMGEDIPALIRRFGERDQTVFVHFRDVVGTVPEFHKTFVARGTSTSATRCGRSLRSASRGPSSPTTSPRWKTTPRGATAATPTRQATSAG